MGKKENQRNVLPPQVFNGEKYCGDYDAFDVANEDDELEEFLGLPRKHPKVEPAKEEPAKEGEDAAKPAAAEGEAKEGESKAEGEAAPAEGEAAPAEGEAAPAAEEAAPAEES